MFFAKQFTCTGKITYAIYYGEERNLQSDFLKK